MKIATKRRNKILPIIIITTVLIAVVVAALIFINRTTSAPLSTTKEPANTIDYNSSSSDQITAGDSAKDEFKNRDSEATLEREKANGTTTIQKTDVSVVISSANVMNDTASIRSILQTIDSSGSCTLELKKSGKTVSRSAGTQTMGSYSTCAGFDISTSELSSGEWSIQLNYIGSSGQAGTAKGTISLP